ncbi:hypothetical protein P154DRAFT_485875 [Amniculicola lignicola CBS 123094]|uniref:BYS1 domain protein n=1 Tax=Amniculicola lignicola CBS 123094 TaxID=1392246 RepID=A0A6A5WST5_9PLEO|nr:hypothetical protein P154DRAFT_485875 [Amniculicola lignicola CBS 123094]
MLFTTLTTLALVATVQAVGRAIVSNLCDAPVYLWSVGSSISTQHVIPRDSSYSEVFHHDPISGGIAIKMTASENGLFNPNVSQTIFAYNLDGGTIWYDMSDLFGDGFLGRRMYVKPSVTSCPEIAWPFGKLPSGEGSQVRHCTAETDLTLTFCTDNCLPSWSMCGDSVPNDHRSCCTHCIGSHHCVAVPSWA